MYLTVQEAEEQVVEGLDKIKVIYAEVKELITNESQTRISLIDKFIRALGYNIEYPTEVQIEQWTNEEYKDRADYIIYRGEKPLIIIEAKSLTHKLNDKDIEQLKGYLDDTPTVNVGILTNGYEYMFFGRHDTGFVCNTPIIKFNIEDVLYDREMKALVSLTKEGEYYESVERHFVKKDVTQAFKTQLNQVMMNPNNDVLRAISRQMGISVDDIGVIQDAYFDSVFQIDMYKEKEKFDNEKRKKAEIEKLRMAEKRTFATAQGMKKPRRIVDMLVDNVDSLVGFKPVELTVNESTYPVNNWVSLQKVLLELMDENPTLIFNVLFRQEYETEMRNMSSTEIPHNKYEVVEYLPQLRMYVLLNNKTKDIEQLCKFIAKYMGFDKLQITLV